MKPLVISSGEPAGIGPDICLALAGHDVPLVVLGDPEVLQARADLLKLEIEVRDYQFDAPLSSHTKRLAVYPISCSATVRPGVLNPAAAGYVLELLHCGAQLCLDGLASALVTAPVHKAVINQAGISFSGHTEYFADCTQTETVVMLLVSGEMRVALVTTHLPLQSVAAHITQESLLTHLEILHHSLQSEFGITKPRIKVAGLNPHAGENGYLGHEESTVIQPVIALCQQRGMDIQGPYSADTLFLASKDCDAFVAMYHDQGLPVIKYASFGHAVNVTCGLPFIRTSVDHGTALELAGSGRAVPDSLLAAVALAAELRETQL
ncbi:MAG: 4-hydroxythreonine-4-phosphate dehydrogenase PdxA [Gammaproteobacteria bacterium]|nr:4-hydroxythreonine-4-phosphate dehydrogenase PdxA [Gammaproteobacteria bacterium]